MKTDEQNCLSYWFPKLAEAGIAVPQTSIIRTDAELSSILDGKTPKGWDELIAEIGKSAARFGFPCFLRTGQGSGKHQWKDTCFIASPDQIPSHVAALIEWSAIVDFMGLDTDVWVVREMLPTEPVCTLPAYGDFPLVPEARAFIRDGKVQCIHPYWPTQAIEEGFPRTYSRLDDEPKRTLPPNFASIVRAAQRFPEKRCLEIAEGVAATFEGYWSVDILPTPRGLFVTDMALGDRSFHWPDCSKKDK